jgi:diaminopimelate epimerase
VPLLSKHHALGNDFLVLFDDQPLPRLAWEAVAVRLCHRHRGLGADGLIVALTNPPEGHDVAMALFNADGSRAEMSGNGIRCLVHAYARRHHLTEGEVVVHTDAGTRPVTFGPGASGREIVARVGMGPATAIDAPEHWADLGCDPLRPVAHLSLGNPHAVVGVDDVRAVDLAALGARVPTVNLEIVAAGPEPFGVTMRVHERGAGITEACGTGACAAAHAADAWGLATPENGEIVVHMDGGDARVALGSELVLIGPSVFIATAEVAL